jgi:hypothetical protein
MGRGKRHEPSAQAEDRRTRLALIIESWQSAGAVLEFGSMSEHQKARRGWSWWHLLFIVQFIAVLWPPFYNSVEPRWIGIPFFYWYQLLWVIIAAVFTAIVYFATEREGGHVGGGRGVQNGQQE